MTPNDKARHRPWCTKRENDIGARSLGGFVLSLSYDSLKSGLGDLSPFLSCSMSGTNWTSRGSRSAAALEAQVAQATPILPDILKDKGIGLDTAREAKRHLLQAEGVRQS